MLSITPNVSLSLEEIRIEFVRAAGPGGQNVNKVATAAQLRFNVRASRRLDEPTKARLLRLAGRRATADGEILIIARRYRTREQNRVDALERLAALVRKALEKPIRRAATRPTLASKTSRLQSKKRRAEVKRLRRSGPEE